LPLSLDSGYIEDILNRALAQPSNNNGGRFMPFVKIWVHLICSTKNRQRIISKELKPLLLQHIKENAKQKEIYLDEINCVEDHIHMLVSLSADQCISKVAQLLKGESSNWINKSKMINGYFEWQDEYIATSISDSVIEIAREYVRNQEEHHKRKSFAEEFDVFIKKYGFEKYLNKN
jgi:REP element-mobilizing transposase RayT